MGLLAGLFLQTTGQALTTKPAEPTAKVSAEKAGETTTKSKVLKVPASDRGSVPSPQGGSLDEVPASDRGSVPSPQGGSLDEVPASDRGSVPSPQGGSLNETPASDRDSTPSHKAQKAKTYRLTVDYGEVNFTGQNKTAMLINGQLPAPTLYFEEGEKAIIYVTNKMDVPTSVHWHGILLPNFQDGVSYLTTPPIMPMKTHKFEFTLQQSGTYWYHSHTGLQEQRGLYGAIVIQAKKNLYQYDHELVLVLSDWTNEDPMDVLRNLKKGSEWYALKKGSALSLWEVVKNKIFKAQMSLWWQRMPGMDISDVYYDSFLINGQEEIKYPHFKAGEKIRLRVVNASASTYFWMSFGGKPPLLISADGIDVKPLNVDKVGQAVAETYDFLVTVPKDQALQIRATAQDGTGFATALIGKGKVLKAPVIPKPNPVEEIRKMALMHQEHQNHHTMGHGTHKEHGAHHKNSHTSEDHSGHSAHSPHKAPHTNHNTHHKMNHNAHSPHKAPHTDHKEHNTHHKMNHSAPKEQLEALDSTAFSNVKEQLEALNSTAFANSQLKEMHLNLTGNMLRYIWSFNGRTLSQSDLIPIKKGETLRLHLHNKTMMHHPMHLHGHFFRVLNGAGEKAPLKHTVDVPPHQTVVIEFNPEEKGDWFFHCHILYHMKSGMSRVFSHGDQRDPRLDNYPLSKVFDGDRAWYGYGEIGLMTNRFNLQSVSTNIRNQIALQGTFSWVDHLYRFSNNFEMDFSYMFFVTDFFRVYGALELEKPHEHPLVDKSYPLFQLKSPAIQGNAKVGLNYLLPLFVELDFNVDNQLRFQLGLDYELLLFPWVEFFAEWEWTWDFGLINRLTESQIGAHDFEWALGLNYILSQNFSLTASYDNRFSYGIGLNWQF